MKLLMKIFSLLLLSYNVKNFPVIEGKILFTVHKTILGGEGWGRGRAEFGVGWVVLGERGEVIMEKCKGKVCGVQAKWPIKLALIFEFCSMKPLGIFLLPCG